MIKTHFSAPTRAWMLLMSLTLLGFLSAELGTLRAASVAAVMGFSALKVRIVLYQFMELGGLPVSLRVFFNAWLFVCAGMILGLFLFAL